jgi:hypothetical protein
MARRKDNLKHRYGITEEQYDQMLVQQKHSCKICGDEPHKPLYVDHCHQTKQVRGLLCHQCNVALGYMKDDPIRMERAADYLRSA